MQICDLPVIFVKETASTNSYLKELNQKGKLTEGTIVITSHQSAGRGQMGTSWESEPNKNLTFSMILYPTKILINQQFILSQIVSLAIQQILQEEKEGFRIKWPNDIYFEDKKICGILIENEIMGNHISSSVIGIGLNVNQTVFTGNAPNPVSLTQITGKEHDLQVLLKKITGKIFQLYSEVKTSQTETIILQYKQHLYRNNGFYPFSDKNGKFMAEINDVRDNGLLVVKTDTGEVKTFSFKEICYLNIFD